MKDKRLIWELLVSDIIALMAERAGYEVALKQLSALPLGGQPPRAPASLRSPREGGTPPSNPRANPALLNVRGVTKFERELSCQVLKSMAERAGFEPAVGG